MNFLWIHPFFSVPEAIRQLESGIKKLDIQEDDHEEAVADFYPNYGSDEMIGDTTDREEGLRLQRREEEYDDGDASITSVANDDDEEEIVVID